MKRAFKQLSFLFLFLGCIIAVYFGFQIFQSSSNNIAAVFGFVLFAVGAALGAWLAWIFLSDLWRLLRAIFS